MVVRGPRRLEVWTLGVLYKETILKLVPCLWLNEDLRNPEEPPLVDFLVVLVSNEIKKALVALRRHWITAQPPVEQLALLACYVYGGLAPPRSRCV